MNQFMNINVPKRWFRKAVLLVQTVATCFRLATHTRQLRGRTALQAKLFLLPAIT